MMEILVIIGQPPSGGCVLKLDNHYLIENVNFQPPSGGCVLKPLFRIAYNVSSIQPPSGGCVLKHLVVSQQCPQCGQPPSGGCVLKLKEKCSRCLLTFSAAFRRLCVETSSYGVVSFLQQISRLQAAVC